MTDRSIVVHQKGDRARFDDGFFRLLSGKAPNGLHGEPLCEDQELDPIAVGVHAQRSAEESRLTMKLGDHMATEIVAILFRLLAARPAAPFANDHGRMTL